MCSLATIKKFFFFCKHHFVMLFVFVQDTNTQGCKQNMHIFTLSLLKHLILHFVSKIYCTQSLDKWVLLHVWRLPVFLSGTVGKCGTRWGVPLLWNGTSMCVTLHSHGAMSMKMCLTMCVNLLMWGNNESEDQEIMRHGTGTPCLGTQWLHVGLWCIDRKRCRWEGTQLGTVAIWALTFTY